MSFVARFFLAALVIGAAELYLLVQVSGRITFLATAALCLVTGALGGYLVRRQGLRTLATIQRAMGQGEVPAEAIVSGLVLLIVGVVLLMPGFVTDVLGFLMLIPRLRQLVARWLARYFRGRITTQGGMGAVVFGYDEDDPDHPRNARAGGRVIDVDVDE